MVESLDDSRSCLGNPYLFSAFRVMYALSHGKSAKDGRVNVASGAWLPAFVGAGR